MKVSPAIPAPRTTTSKSRGVSWEEALRRIKVGGGAFSELANAMEAAISDTSFGNDGKRHEREESKGRG